MVAKWVAILAIVFGLIVLIAKYPDLLRGEFPTFRDGELFNTVLLAAAGTALVGVIKGRVRDLKRRMSRGLD
jgi:hypothetical protein